MKPLLFAVVLIVYLSWVECAPASKGGVQSAMICKVEKNGEVHERKCPVGECSKEGKVIHPRGMPSYTAYYCLVSEEDSVKAPSRTRRQEDFMEEMEVEAEDAEIEELDAESSKDVNQGKTGEESNKKSQEDESKQDEEETEESEED